MRLGTLPLGVAVILFGSLLLQAVALAHGVKSLADFINAFNEGRLSLEPDRLAVAEFFAWRANENRFYLHDLKLLPPETNADLTKLHAYLASYEDLNQTGDMDALVDAIKLLEPGLPESEFTDKTRLGFHLQTKVKRACTDFVNAIGPSVFESIEFRDLDASGELAVQVYQAHFDTVKRFLLGWAHYHACRLLVFSDNERLIDKTTRRAPVHARVQAKLARLRGSGPAAEQG